MQTSGAAAFAQPFLKWAGGKRWLAERLAPAFKAMEGTYREPFLGSGAVFFRYGPTSAVLSDANKQLIECYQQIQSDPSGVQAALTEVARFDPGDSYYEIRASNPASANERVARFLYLNRTCWNGLYRVNLKGQFNVPRGTKNDILLPTDDFGAVSKALATAVLRAADFEENIAEAVAGDLIFADPPYTVAHNTNGFVKYNQTIFSWADQKRLAQSLNAAARRGVTIIATNADHPDVRELYLDFPHSVSLARASVIAASSTKRRNTTELLVTNSPVGATL